EPGVGDAEPQIKTARAPREAATGQERMEMVVAGAADGQVVSPRAQEPIECGDAIMGFPIDLIQQAMAGRAVRVHEIEGVVVEQAEDSLERRILPGILELRSDQGGLIE